MWPDPVWLHSDSTCIRLDDLGNRNTLNLHMEEDDQPISWLLSLPLSGISLTLSEVFHMGFSLAEQVRKSGGRARCLRQSSAVTVELSGMRREDLQTLIDAFTDSMSQRKETLRLSFEQRDGLPETHGDDSVLPGEYFRGKLTKRLLMSLPVGAFVVSNFMHSGQPVFAAKLGDQEEREQQWVLAVKADAAQRTCDVLWDSADVLECHGIDL